MSVGSLETQSVIRAADNGEDLWVMGGLFSYRATPSETGAYLACEVRAQSGFAIPVHFHDDEEEGFYVAQGVVTVVLDGVEHRLSAGGFALAPRGASHAFRFETTDAVLLLLVSPGHRHEGMFRAMGEPAEAHIVPSSPGSLEPDALGQIADGFGTHIVGPPPTAPAAATPTA
jgi:quercetin dioxygenase-like cupin family protein